jgi:hypothetical protein
VLSRLIDISDQNKPAMEIVGGIERPAGPVNIEATGFIARVCRKCSRLMSSETRRVRVTSAGQWVGTKIVDVFTGVAVDETFSVLVHVDTGGRAVADILANYLTPDGHVALCPECR